MTHTYVLMEVSRAAFDEIRAKLEAVQYNHAVIVDRAQPILDMHGLALVQEKDENN